MKKINLLLFAVLIILCGCSVNHLDSLETSGYTLQADEVYYAIVTVKGGITNIDGNTMQDDAGFRTQIEQFNQSESGESKAQLKISMIGLGLEDSSSTPVVVIRRFEKYDGARQYANRLVKFLKRNDLSVKSVFPISQINYRNLIRRKDLEEYQQFSRKITASR